MSRRNPAQLRKISDSVYAELESTQEGSTPLEWRRSFNHVRLPLADLKVVSAFYGHKTDFDSGRKQADTPLNLVKPNFSFEPSVTARVDLDQMRDTLYAAWKSREDPTLIETGPRYEGIDVSIRTLEPSQGLDRLPDGVCEGVFVDMEFEGESRFSADLYLPKDQLQSIIESLGRGYTRATLDVELLSFSHEVDDALAEPWMAQTLLVDDSNRCFSNCLRLDRAAPVVEPVVGDDSDDDVDEMVHHDEDERSDVTAHSVALEAEQARHTERLQAQAATNELLNKVVVAIWVLALGVVGAAAIVASG